MDYVWLLIKYLGDHPVVALAGVLAVAVGYRLLTRKPKLIRDAEARFETLRKDRGDYYRKQRPLS